MPETCHSVIAYRFERVEIAPPTHMVHNWEDHDRTMEDLRQWAKEINDFLAQHTHWRGVGAEVCFDSYRACSNCGEEWEVFTDDGDGNALDPFCAGCGTPVGKAAKKEADDE